MSRWVGVIDHQPQLIFPTSLRGQGVKLMLLENMRGKAIGISSGVFLGRGQ